MTFETRRRFGYMPEERGLYPKMRVTEHLVYLARLHGLDAAAAVRSADALTERLGVAERRADAIEKLSLGNQQRVQLAAALVHDPEVLVLDEPFSGLDPVGVDALAGVLLERARRGVPVVFSSHQLDLVERLCDSVGIVNAGRMVATGHRRAAARRRRAGGSCWSWCRTRPAGWAAALPGVTVVSERRGELVLELAQDVDDQQVLAAAARAGRVEHFSRREPTLTELFREAVVRARAGRSRIGREPPSAGGGGMSAARPRRAARHGAAGPAPRDHHPGPGAQLPHLHSGHADHRRCGGHRAEPVQLEQRRRDRRRGGRRRARSRPALEQAAQLQDATLTVTRYADEAAARAAVRLGDVDAVFLGADRVLVDSELSRQDGAGRADRVPAGGRGGPARRGRHRRRRGQPGAGRAAARGDRARPAGPRTPTPAAAPRSSACCCSTSS